MKLSLLLFALSMRLRLRHRLSAEFRKKLRERACVLVMRTEDGRQARTFTFRDGQVRSRAGWDRAADTELVWCDADTAVKAMLSRDELDMFSAIGRSQLRILGNLAYALWFTEVAG
jgi:hypothetical protein